MQTSSRPILITALAAVMLITPLLASAENTQCRFSEPRALKLDLTGVSSVTFQVGSSSLQLKAAPGGSGALEGRACASSESLLQGMQLTQKRTGEKLVVTLMDSKTLKRSFSGSSYWYMDITGNVPDNVLVQLDVGSGDASLAGAKAASADVGSGDVNLRDIAGLVTAKVGSGDLTLQGAGAFTLLALGSGQAEASQIAGQASAGSVGSGDLTLKGIGAGFSLERLGSGNIDVSDVTGNVQVGSVGSGDLIIHDVRGNLSVRDSGSGDIDQHGITGSVDLPRKH